MFFVVAAFKAAAAFSAYSFNRLTLLGAPAWERRFVFLRVNLVPASVVGHRYLHLLARGVSAAVRAGDSNSIDASVAATFPLGSK
jgi:hypothetical protein